MNKLAIVASLAAAGLALQPVANAGLVLSRPVTITITQSPFTTHVDGSFHQELLTTDHVSYIECTVFGDAHSSWIGCSAKNVKGLQVDCVNLAPSTAMRDVVNGINQYSEIAWVSDVNDTCTSIMVKHATFAK
jgi:hypothetical protein